MTTQLQTVYRGAAGEAFDWRCDARRGDRAAEPPNESHLVVLTRSGHFTWRVGRAEVAGTPGTALVARAGLGYVVDHPACGGDRCTVLGFDDDQWGRAWEGDDDPTGAAIAEWATGSRAQLAHYRFLRACAAKDPLSKDSTFVELVTGLSPRPTISPAPGRRQFDRVRKARELLAVRFRERLTLEEVAGVVGGSPFHLARSFAADTGVPIHQYQLRLRLQAALDALLEGCDDLTGLALDLGFCDHAHFTGTFVRAYGVPPSKLRGDRRARRSKRSPPRPA